MLSHWRRRGGWVTLAGSVAATLLCAGGVSAAVVGMVSGTRANAGATVIPASVTTAVPRLNHRHVIGTLARSVPVRIRIPAIGVSAPVMKLGKNPDGTVQVPPLADHNMTGWYQYGPAPGQPGPAVILGHVDSTTGISVFYQLKDLRRGNLVYITLADGKVAAFAVDGLQKAAKDTFPTAAVYGTGGYPGLRLITCGGPFDQATGHYLDNIVIYAHLTGGTAQPTAAAGAQSPSPSRRVAVRARPTVTVTARPTVTVTARPTVTVTARPTVTVTARPTVTVTARPTVTVTARPTVTMTARPTVTATARPTVTVTARPMVTATARPAATATAMALSVPSGGANSGGGGMAGGGMAGGASDTPLIASGAAAAVAGAALALLAFRRRRRDRAARPRCRCSVLLRARSGPRLPGMALAVVSRVPAGHGHPGSRPRVTGTNCSAAGRRRSPRQACRRWWCIWS